MASSQSIHVGCAGWAIPSEHRRYFPDRGSHLARYAAVLPAVEINSSFYRPHRPGTYRRWAETVAASFRFSVKISREISHRSGLQRAGLLDSFLPGPVELGDRLGPLLLQLPPKLALSAATARSFFARLRDRYDGPVVCEPRHPSWFSADAEGLLAAYRIARVAADPPVVPAAAEPAAWRGISYYRLHGSPQKYRSSYPERFLDRLSDRLQAALRDGPVWCIFDNTAAGAAIPNALSLLQRLQV